MKSGVPYEILPEKREWCQTCEGTGIFWGITGTDRYRCPDCDGTGNSSMTIVKCFVCSGEGRYYLFEDCDVVEGYKLAHKRGVCRFCKGEGHIADDDKRMPGVLAYLAAMKEVEEDCLFAEKERKEEKAKLVASGLAKLTDDEIIALELTMR